MKKPLRILLAEDDASDAALILLELERAGFFPECVRVDSEEDYLAELHKQPDIILSDYQMPKFSGLRALELSKRSRRSIPFILISGTLGEEAAVEVIKLGASDYLLKDRLTRLGSAISQAIDRHQLRKEYGAAVDALRQSERLARTSLDALSANIAILDEAGVILSVNRAWREFAKQSCAEDAPVFEGANYLRACRNAVGDEAIYGQSFAEGIQAIIDGKCEEFALEYPCHTPTVERWFIGRITRTPGLPPQRIVVAHENITERKNAERSVREQAAMLDLAHDAIIVRDFATRRIQYWNQGAERLYGWLAAEAVGSDIGELICVDRCGPDQIAEQLSRTREWHGEVRHVAKGGTELIVSARATLVSDAAGRPRAVLSINTDITEKKQIEEQFFRAQRMESLGTLAAGIAHDLNNVLGPMIMAVDLLKLGVTDPRGLDLLDLMEASGQRGAEMVKQILFFARGMQGSRSLVSPAALAHDLLGIARDTFPKPIRLEIEAPEDTWETLGDRTQLHQVLLNLCVNARDAMPLGGVLRIVTRNVVIDQQFASMQTDARPGSYVVLEVADTGEGIPPEVQAKIFEPFFTTKEIGEGTGLGLSTTLAIVKNHGGFIKVESKRGKGTTFTVHLPAETAPGKTRCPAAPRELLRGRGEVILIIDDEASVRSITAQTLEAFGYRVRSAADGTEGVALYAEFASEIAMVITDMVMPEMDGAATIRILQKMNPALKIIATSGATAKWAEADAAELGVRHFLAKPYTAETMLKIVDGLLHANS